MRDTDRERQKCNEQGCASVSVRRQTGSVFAMRMCANVVFLRLCASQASVSVHLCMCICGHLPVHVCVCMRKGRLISGRKPMWKREHADIYAGKRTYSGA